MSVFDIPKRGFGRIKDLRKLDPRWKAERYGMGYRYVLEDGQHTVVVTAYATIDEFENTYPFWDVSVDGMACGYRAGTPAWAVERWMASLGCASS